MDFQTTATKIAGALSCLPKYWDGRRVILEMKSADFPHWRQMEWIGFYFEFLCSKHLSGITQIPGPRYGNVEFDGFLDVPWDFKAHAMNASRDQVIVNDSLAISAGIQEFGCVGLILAMGKVEYNDENRSFKKWHNGLKGGLSDYEKERSRRRAPSRSRKVSFDLQRISFIQITDETLVISGSFQSGFRNSNGRPRKGKLLLDLKKIDKEVVCFVEF